MNPMVAAIWQGVINGLALGWIYILMAIGLTLIFSIMNIVQLAHVASHQGIVAVQNASGKISHMDYTNVPSAIFTDPEVGTVGMSEKAAKSQNLSISVSKFNFAGNKLHERKS